MYRERIARTNKCVSSLCSYLCWLNETSHYERWGWLVSTVSDEEELLTVTHFWPPEKMESWVDVILSLNGMYQQKILEQNLCKRRTCNNWNDFQHTISHSLFYGASLSIHWSNFAPALWMIVEIFAQLLLRHSDVLAAIARSLTSQPASQPAC